MDDMNHNQDPMQGPEPPPYNSYNMNQHENQGYTPSPYQPPQNNTLGIVSLVSGIAGLIFSICCYPLGIVLSILALICGIIGNQRGQQYALAGIILGAISLLLSLVFIILGAVFLDPIMDEFMREFQHQQL